MPDIQIAAPDLLGHGSRGGDRDISLESTLCALSTSHDDCKPRPEVLLGYSLGGRIALNWVLAEPQRFKALILISSSAGLQGAEEEREQRLETDTRWMERLAAEPLDTWLESWDRQPVFRRPDDRKIPELEAAQKRRHSADALGWAAAMSGLSTGRLPFLGNSLREIKIPVLLITGEHDSKFCELNASMSELLEAQHSVIAKAGHRPHLEQPQAVAEVTKNFVTRLD